MDNSTAIMLGVLLGSIGLGYFIYGKKQRSVTPLVSGICLMILPYFIHNVFLLLLIAIALMSAPKFIDF